MNLFKKIAKARILLSVEKTGHNGFGNYDFYQLDEIYKNAKKVFEELGITTYSQMTPNMNPQTGAYTGFVLVLNVVNTDKPEERFDVVVSSESETPRGMSKPQSAGSVKTYLTKYAYADLLMLDDGASDMDTMTTKEGVTTAPKTFLTQAERKELVEKLDSLSKVRQAALIKKHGLKDNHAWQFTKTDVLLKIQEEL